MRFHRLDMNQVDHFAVDQLVKEKITECQTVRNRVVSSAAK